jgi:hypothetical protein
MASCRRACKAMRKQRFQVGVSDQNVLRRTATFLKPSVFFGYFFFGNAKKSNIQSRSKNPNPNINLNPHYQVRIILNGLKA